MSSVEDVRNPTIPTKMDETNENGRKPASDAINTDAIVTVPSKYQEAPTSQRSHVDEEVATKIFRFLSTATPGNLGGVGIGLAAMTYLVLGRVGLVLLGAFGGVVLFIYWEQRDANIRRAVQGETGYELLARLLQVNGKPSKGAGVFNSVEEDHVRLHGLDHLPAETRQAMTELINAIINDYVKWWYAPIVPSDNSFPLACRKTLTSFVAAISHHLGRKRSADAFLDFLTNSSSIIIVFLSELSNAFAEQPSDSKASAADTIYDYMASNPDSNLANLLNQHQQAAKFRMISDDLLGFLDRSVYDCEAAKVFLREIIAGVILEMTLQTWSKPEWINSWIVYLLESGEPDFSQAIDVGMQTGPNQDSSFLDLDGNVGNIGVTKGNRNSFENEKARRKESMVHKKKLSKADEEMEMAMEEMKKMNRMIADAEAQKAKEPDKDHGSPKLKKLPGPAKETVSEHEASKRLAGAFKRNVDELDITAHRIEQKTSSGKASPVYETSDKGSTRESGSEGRSSKEEPLRTPTTPASTLDSMSQDPSPKRSGSQRFTSFDQIVPPSKDQVDSTSAENTPRLPGATLHNATVTILDEPCEKGRIKNKPTWDYLIQIEPGNTAFPGWMIVRRYSDFEKVHEVIRRIATITGATAFREQHNELPSWKIHTRTSLRGELERYIRDACWYQSIAECEAMKKFLEKDSANVQMTPKGGFQAFEKLGKNVFDAISTGADQGSKAVVGGVTGVLGNIGLVQKRSNYVGSIRESSQLPSSTSLQDVTAASRFSIGGPVNGIRRPRDSIDSQRSIVSTQPPKNPVMERRPSYQSQGETDADNVQTARGDVWDRAVASSRNSRDHSRASSLAPARSPSVISFDGIKLPPPPDAISDDYDPPLTPAHVNGHATGIGIVSPGRVTSSPNTAQRAFEPPLKGHKAYSPMTEQETRVAVELLFAVINEMYTLSSAWNIRRTLLAAAKSFLLRPGNPSLVSIQTLLQTDVIDANTSDVGMAAHLRKLRENTMPTEAERAAWPAEMTDEEKEKLRVKARRLLIQSGVPAALSGVMGQSATGEALGRVFDSLQIERVARGLMFGVMLQAVRTITH